MDSTPIPISTHPRTHPISIKAAARKLPIKRKNPDPTPTPNPNPIPPVPKLELSVGDYADDDEEIEAGGDRDVPPFKYHRIWTEPDEIRFLRGLLDCSADNLSFPRDLHVFYARFSQTMSQPYTKSQLSEKLRRLRKKFRVISARLARGVDFSLLSPHDRALFELSKKLWHPDFDSVSPFGKSSNSIDNVDNKKRITSIGSDGGGGSSSSSLVGVKVSFSPTLLLKNSPHLHQIGSSPERGAINDMVIDDDDNNEDENGGDVAEDYMMNEVKIDYDFGERQEVALRESKSCLGDATNAVGNIAAKSVVAVFDEALKEVRTMQLNQGIVCPDNGSSPVAAGSSSQGKALDFEKRWREQRVAELDVLARRWRLVLENSLRGQ